MGTHLRARHLPAVSVVSTLAAVVVLSLVGSLIANAVPEWLGHGVGPPWWRYPSPCWLSLH